jgi:hypothetical protein
MHRQSATCVAHPKLSDPSQVVLDEAQRVTLVGLRADIWQGRDHLIRIVEETLCFAGSPDRLAPRVEVQRPELAGKLAEYRGDERRRWGVEGHATGRRHDDPLPPEAKRDVLTRYPDELGMHAGREEDDAASSQMPNLKAAPACHHTNAVDGAPRVVFDLVSQPGGIVHLFDIQVSAQQRIGALVTPRVAPVALPVEPTRCTDDKWRAPPQRRRGRIDVGRCITARRDARRRHEQRDQRNKS